MTEEQKQLLIKDLCGRLPYGVNILHVKDGIIGVLSTINIYVDGREQKLKCSTSFFGEDNVPIEEFKPYLYPLSSLTSSEAEEIERIMGCNIPWRISEGLIEWTVGGSVESETFELRIDQIERLTEFLNAHHFDYRGLIEKGLAINATGVVMYSKEREP